MAAIPTGSSNALEAALREALDGDVRFDSMSRILYSTDASNYRMMPTGVALPRHTQDVSAVVQQVIAHDGSVVPRGGGTSLSGQTVGPGVIIDGSRYLDSLIELDTEKKTVEVNSGHVLDLLNRKLRPHGLMVGPDPASAVAATLGGMTGNNSTGSHSIVYGMMVDHVQEVEVVLSDGSIVRFGPKTPFEAQQIAQRDTLEGRLYREVPKLLRQYEDDIRGGYPQTWRNVAGYNLNRIDQILPANGAVNLAPLIVGSEGTLGVITAVKLNVVDIPAHARLLLLHYDDLGACLRTVPAILEHNPSAVELVDRYFNHLTRRSPEYGPMLTFIDGDPRAVLIVEFTGSDPAELDDRAEKLEKALRGDGFGGTIVHRSKAAEIAQVWSVRKAGLGLLMSQRGDAKPLAFVDDATVPVNHLAEFALAFEQVCKDNGTDAAFYAHASAGCLHINPMINLKTARGLDQLRQISQAVATLAIEHGGTTTGEHGEGFARSHYNKQLYGERLHQAFREVKGLFDPDNRMNPGKIIDAPLPWDPEVLRISPQYATPQAPNVTIMDFSADGSFAGLVEMCNGQGVCRQREGGTMCPSFRATRDEDHSVRGRANALRAAMTGQLGEDGMLSDELHDVLDLCISCKACKRECPSLVDMAKLKYEYLAMSQAAKGVPLRSRLFGNIAALNWWGAILPPIANWSFKQPAVRKILEERVGIDSRRSIPPLVSEPFRDWFQRRQAKMPEKTMSRGPVVLWDDTFITYNDPSIGRDAVKVLEAAGFEVLLVKKRKCCGRPMISKGLLKQAQANAEHNIAQLLPFAKQGIPIVGIEPSCVTTLRDEYLDLVPGEGSQLVAEHTYFLDEFLAQLAREGELNITFNKPTAPKNVLVHGHCQEKATIGTTDLLDMLNLLPDTTVTLIESSCCGMAGSFGYEKEHYDVSMAMGEISLFPAVRGADAETVIVAAGTSCRHQIADGTERDAIHPVELLAMYLN